jgi:hypothetical protein
MNSITLVPYSQLAQRFEAAPPGKLFCLHGDASVFRLSLHAAAHTLLRGVPIALVDGANRFDPYYIAGFARKVTSRTNAHVTPGQLLQQIHVARAFTCYQMEATITERLPEFLKRSQAPVAIIFGLLDTFYDEQAPLFEVRASVGRMIAGLQRLKKANISVLLASLDVRPASKGRNELFPRIQAVMDHTAQLVEGQFQGRLYEPQRRRDAEDERDNRTGFEADRQ